MAQQLISECVSSVRGSSRVSRNRSFLAWRFQPNATCPHDGVWQYLGPCIDGVYIYKRGTTDYYVSATGGLDDIGPDHLEKNLHDSALGGLYSDLAAWLRMPANAEARNYSAICSDKNPQFIADLGPIRLFVSFSYRGWGDFLCAVNRARAPCGYMRYW